MQAAEDAQALIDVANVLEHQLNIPQTAELGVNIYCRRFVFIGFLWLFDLLAFTS